MMLVKIVGTVFLFLTVPFGYGRLLTFRNKGIRDTDYLSLYVYGLALFYALFSCITLVLTIARRPFREVVYAGIVLIVAALLFVLIDYFYNRRRGGLISWVLSLKKVAVKNWWLVFPACIILFQIVRSVVRMNGVYSDDDSYLPLILDMIRTDTILGTEPVSGELHNYYALSNPKYVLTACLQFYAALSSIIRIHPLILIKSILPVFFISWHYLIVWKITYYLSRDYGKRIVALLFYVLLMEFGSPSLNTDLSYYLFTWSWYGKSLLQFIGIPMLILFFLEIRAVKTGWREGLTLMAVVMAGMGLSTMGLILFTIMVSVFVLLECVEKRSVRELWIMVPAFLPIIVYALLYFTMF